MSRRRSGGPKWCSVWPPGVGPGRDVVVVHFHAEEGFALATTIVAFLAVFIWLFAPPAPAQPRTFVWKVQSSFPVTDYPHRSLVEVAKSIEQMSGGRLKIEALPVGSVVGFFEVLDAVNRGALDGGLTWPGLWAGKNSAAGLSSVPPSAGRSEWDNAEGAGGESRWPHRHRAATTGR